MKLSLDEFKSDKGSDPLEIYFDEPKKKKKKGDKKDKEKDKKGKDKDKKKDKKKDKDELSKKEYKESIKDMSKSELRKMLIKLNVNLDTVDTTSKKEMREAIANTRFSKTFDKYVTHEPFDPTAVADAHKLSKKDKREIGNIRENAPRPPYYYVEDGENAGDFCISNVKEARDLDLVNAMTAVGHIRRQVRPDDGFAELMDRLTNRLTESEQPEQPKLEDAIEVSYRDVTEEHDTIDDIIMTESQLKAIEKTVDAAISEMAGKRKKK